MVYTNSLLAEAMTDRVVYRYLRFMHQRDAQTHDHLVRVAASAAHVAPHFFKSALEQFYFVRGAALHDAGKLETPNEILLLEGGLTPGEREIMLAHSSIGFDILRKIDPYSAWMAKAHHEDRRSLAPTLLGVIDAYDALRNRRPYKDPYGRRRTERELYADFPGNHHIVGRVLELL